MDKFLVETECAQLTDHHLFWCSKCNTNKVDSLEQSSGRFFCVSGHEFTGSVGECKQIVFALCPTCLATNMWGPLEEEVKPPTANCTWAEVQGSTYFTAALGRRELVTCINMARSLMNSSPEVATALVMSLLED